MASPAHHLPRLLRHDALLPDLADVLKEEEHYAVVGLERKHLEIVLEALIAAQVPGYRGFYAHDLPAPSIARTMIACAVAHRLIPQLAQAETVALAVRKPGLAALLVLWAACRKRVRYLENEEARAIHAARKAAA